MRRDPQELEDRELELIYIAAALDEAKRIEAILDELEIDYTVQVEQYRAGIIFASVRAGAFFYVVSEMAGRSREALTARGYKVQEPM